MRALWLAVTLAAAARAALQRAPCQHSNSQVKKMVAPRAVDAPSARTARSAQVTNAAEVEGWFAEWGGPAPLWRKVQCTNQNVAARRQLFAHRHVP